MSPLFRFIYIYIFLLPCSICGETISQEICRKYIECRRDMLDIIVKCPDDTNEVHSVKDSNGQRSRYCLSLAKEKLKMLHSLLIQQQYQVLDCVQKRINDTTPVHPKKVRVCNGKVLEDYAQFVDVRQNSTNVTGGTAHRSGKPANDVNWYEYENLYENLQRTDDRGGPRRKRWRRDGRGVPVPARKQCLSQATRQGHQCAILSTCCSAVTRCDNEFKSTSLYIQISQSQLDIFNQLRQCQS